MEILNVLIQDDLGIYIAVVRDELGHLKTIQIPPDVANLVYYVVPVKLEWDSQNVYILLDEGRIKIKRSDIRRLMENAQK